MPSQSTPPEQLRHRLHTIIYEADTPAGKAFDIILLFLIVCSIVAVMLESVAELDARYHSWFVALEWIITILFSMEYILRLYAVQQPIRYARSFYGIIDLLSILPTYISVLFPGMQYLATIRALRLLRIFRIFKLGRYLGEGHILLTALRNSRAKIIVFLTAVFTVVVVVGSVMYLIEGEQGSGFTSIPRSIYWAVVTITTVGYGDITPVTTIGQFLSAVLMVTGYAIIAVPTGIVSMEISRAQQGKPTTQACRNCSREGHDTDAQYCKFCGEPL